jgi:hypothetical protein
MYYIADFETTVPDIDDDTIENIETRVWSWGICELNSPSSFMYGTDIHTFIEWCSKVSRTVYFHNLKFDGKFIIDYLLRSGFVYDEDRKTDKSFTCLISEYGQFYSIEIVFKVYEKMRISTVFYDSSKKIPLSVSNIAKSFNLEIQKGSIDYKKDRPIGYEPDLNELSYLKNDVCILGEALHVQHSQGLTRMTIGGDALFHYKTIVGKQFGKWFPDVFDKEGYMFLNLKLFYRGGFTFVNKKHQGKDIGKGVTYDVTSLYPSVMKNELLPYGQPIHFDGKYDESFREVYPLYCQSIRVEFKLKPGHIPFVNDRSGYLMKTIEYMEQTQPFVPVTLHLTNIELELFYKHYDVIEIEFINGYMFKGRHGMFDEYINHWIEIKEQADKDNNPGLRQIAKLMLNSLYGKFGKNIFMGGKIPELNHEKDKVIYTDKTVTIEKGVYIPIAIFVTSYARLKMVSSAQSCYDRFIYCDTDSLHLVGTESPTTIDIHDYNLGSWKYEGQFTRARFLRAKAYIHEYSKKKIRKKTWLIRPNLMVKCSGMPPNIKDFVTWDNFQFGFTAFGKKTPKTIKGGTLLVDTSYTLME